MRVLDTSLPGVVVVEPTVFDDHRGFFFESFNQRAFEQAVGCGISFVQDNQSRSNRGVLRGLHYQLDPVAQGKLVRVVYGEIFDVAVDIRRSSPHFGQWTGRVLSADNKRQLWVPPGFAHGFLALSETADVVYKTTEYWAKGLARTIAWDCPEIDIKWPLSERPILSAIDAVAPNLSDAELFS